MVHDLEILAQEDLPWRKYLSVTHRVAQKEVLMSQYRILTILKFIVQRIKAYQSLKDAYLAQHESEDTLEEMLQNRIMLRKYFQELNHFSRQSF